MTGNKGTGTVGAIVAGFLESRSDNVHEGSQHDLQGGDLDGGGQRE